MLISIKTNWRHCALEEAVRKADPVQGSRTIVFERAVKAARGVKSWKAIMLSLSNLRENKETPVTTSYQVRCDEDTAAMLEDIREDICEQLDIKVLQMQFLLQLLYANYLETLRREKIAIRAAEGYIVSEKEIDAPGMGKLFLEMLLTDRNCEEIQQIREILVGWKNKITKGE